MRANLVSVLPARASHGMLFCIHHAGGGSAAFRRWQDLLGPSIQIGTVVLPGRERLAGEPLATDFGAVVERICCELQVLVGDRRYSLFGHSLGAAIAFEVSCRLERSASRPPSSLIVSGRGAVHLDDADPDRHPRSALPDPEFIDLIRESGGTPAQILENPELLELILPRIRADFRLAESYRWDGRTRSRCPILVLGGKSDVSADTQSLARWRDLTTGEVTLRLFEGGHFFVTSCEIEVCRTISAFLERSSPAY